MNCRLIVPHAQWIVLKMILKYIFKFGLVYVPFLMELTLEDLSNVFQTIKIFKNDGCEEIAVCVLARRDICIENAVFFHVNPTKMISYTYICKSNHTVPRNDIHYKSKRDFIGRQKSRWSIIPKHP